MGDIFRTKVRNVGTSLGVLLPKEIVKKENVRVGDEVEVSIFRSLPKEERRKLIKKSFGMFRSSRSKLLKFERDRKDREF